MVPSVSTNQNTFLSILHSITIRSSVDYIDTVFGEGSLWPEDPYRKAMAQVFIDDFGKKVKFLTVTCVFHDQWHICTMSKNTIGPVSDRKSGLLLGFDLRGGQAFLGVGVGEAKF